MSQNAYKLLYKLTVLVHWITFITLALAIPLSLVLQPFYMFVVVTTVVVRIVFSREICPLSTLECHIAAKAGIKGHILFMKGHILPLLRKLRLKQ